MSKSTILQVLFYLLLFECSNNPVISESNHIPRDSPIFIEDSGDEDPSEGYCSASMIRSLDFEENISTIYGISSFKLFFLVDNNFFNKKKILSKILFKNF